jgi:hypothetical protein
MPELPPDFESAIRSLADPVVIGAALALLLREIAKFNQLPRWIKWTSVAVVGIGMPVLSHALEIYLTPGIRSFFAEWWPYFRIGLLVWITSQVTNEKVIKTSERKESVFVRNDYQGRLQRFAERLNRNQEDAGNLK